MTTISYYDKNAKSFYERTINLDMSQDHQKFLSYLSKSTKILDAGCGVGRDAKVFQDLGHKVTAFDASIEMVKQSSIVLSCPSLHLSFYDIEFFEEFDGVWASASLLHIPYADTRSIFERIHQSLKPKGIFYASYKYGQDKMVAEEREFYNMTESMIPLYSDGLFEIIEMWQTTPHPTNTQPNNWLSIIFKKL